MGETAERDVWRSAVTVGPTNKRAPSYVVQAFGHSSYVAPPAVAIPLVLKRGSEERAELVRLQDEPVVGQAITLEEKAALGRLKGVRPGGPYDDPHCGPLALGGPLRMTSTALRPQNMHEAMAEARTSGVTGKTKKPAMINEFKRLSQDVGRFRPLNLRPEFLHADRLTGAEARLRPPVPAPFDLAAVPQQWRRAGDVHTSASVDYRPSYEDAAELAPGAGYTTKPPPTTFQPRVASPQSQARKRNRLVVSGRKTAVDTLDGPGSPSRQQCILHAPMIMTPIMMLAASRAIAEEERNRPSGAFEAPVPSRSR